MAIYCFQLSYIIRPDRKVIQLRKIILLFFIAIFWKRISHCLYQINQPKFVWLCVYRGGSRPPPPFWGTPKLHKEGKNVARRILVLNSYLDPSPPFQNPVSAPGLGNHKYLTLVGQWTIKSQKYVHSRIKSPLKGVTLDSGWENQYIDICPCVRALATTGVGFSRTTVEVQTARWAFYLTGPWANVFSKFADPNARFFLINIEI